MAESGPKKVANSLVAASCAAVLAVYSAGYIRTRSAANRFEVQASERRAAVPQAEDSGRVEIQSVATPVEESTPSRPSREPLAQPQVSAIAEAVPAVPVPAAAVQSSPLPVETPVQSTVAPPPELVASIAAPSVPVPEIKPVISAPAPPPASAPPAPKWKDGTYLGWGSSRHGDIQAQVVIEGGRIQSATIAQCRTRYSCSVIDRLPPQVAQRQSPDVDYVSRATQSADAFYYAVVEALGKAK